MRTRYPEYMDSGAYERTISIIRQYPKIVKELEIARNDIINKSSTQFIGMPGSNIISDPTANKGIRLTNIKITEMERKITAFHKAWDELGEMQQDIITQRFWKEKRLDDIEFFGHVNTIRAIIKNFILRVAFFLGEID